jgi:hypothetical protein
MRVQLEDGSSATLVKKAHQQNLMKTFICSWSHTDFFPILLLQTLSPNLTESQTHAESVSKKKGIL